MFNQEKAKEIYYIKGDSVIIAFSKQFFNPFSAGFLYTKAGDSKTCKEAFFIHVSLYDENCIAQLVQLCGTVIV